jgi:S-adenosyl-L-methionine hydrolase (adenosine-forming)
VLSLALEGKPGVSVRHVIAENYFLHPVSQTFHGRDIFAAVAGWLSTGLEPSDFGPEITDYVRLTIPAPKTSGSKIQGVVLKVDKFGNVVTNVSPRDNPQLLTAHPPAFKIVLGNREITSLRTSYAEGASGEVFGIVGSMGLLELAMNRGSAAAALKAEKGTEVVVSGKW